MSPGTETSMSNAVGKADRTGYHLKALQEIRNSLRPFATENGSPLPTIPKDGHISYQQHLYPYSSTSSGYIEHENGSDGYMQRSDGQILQRSATTGVFPPSSGQQVHRKPSFEREPRSSPAFDTSSAASSNRSDSPAAYFNGLGLVRGHVAPEAPPYSSRNAYPSSSDPPPPPPPPRGATPPPPPLPPPPSAASKSTGSQHYPSNFQLQQMLKRMSPVPNAPPIPGPRGTSPAPALPPGRLQPLVVQNGPQAQAQLTQQMQALNMYQQQPSNGSSPLPPSSAPPPPYPTGSASKLVAPPPPYRGPDPGLSNRQSPTLPSPTGKSPAPFPPPTSSSSVQSAGRCPPNPAWPPRQTPIIMQSVKSTQVQKPILQTAVAPSGPPQSSSSPPPPPIPVRSNPAVSASPPPPPPPYSSSGYASSSCPSPSSYAPMASPSPLSFASTPSPVPSSPAPVPTTDPPSYASTMQALAAQRQHGTTPTNATNALAVNGYNLSATPPPPPPYPSSMANGGTGLAQQVEPQNSPHGQLPPKPGQRRFSPLTLEAPSSRSESPMSSSAASQCDSGRHGGPSQSPVSFVSSSAPSEGTQDSGLGMSTKNDVNGHGAPSIANGEDGKDDMPPPPPPPYKLTHQSPIPERKHISREREEERRESSVRNYSPQAFKFFMEQHVENLLKSHQQRMERRMQLETEMKKIGLSEEAQCQMRRMLSQKESNYIRLKRAKMNKAMFLKIKAIGVGAFGEVALVRKIDTNNHLYAMKTLRKTDVLKRNQVAHVKAERDILAEADNEWVVKLYYSFQDKDNLYFVMDYIPGGDLMSLLIKLGIFEEHLARFYIAELVCAVESVHKMGFIHRDIKPDNILIDRDGHIKLTDFGLCTGFRWTHNSKYYQRNGDHSRQDSFDPGEDWTNECRCNNAVGGNCNTFGTPHITGHPPVLKTLERRRRREHQRCLAHSLVGTPNYIAPEVLLRTGYTQLCDWWSVGVILYEMLVGQPPFMANTPAETQYKVINWSTTLQIPNYANLSPEAADLIVRLCTSADQRLGRGGAGELKTHPFFNGVDFDGGLRNKTAPYIPKIRFATDTSNFDPIVPDKLRNSADEDKMDNTLDNGKHPVHAFFEFTFRRFFDDGGHPRMNPDENEPNHGPVYV
ncbi:serine/threonine-protein kinase Warts isoform X1 [Daphnia magna]|uniref:serine/threonine-protein kinase Warts isoform X1 n=1 Tax=Daphnia magna TaxID=35525 RepID=UPI001E1BDB3B|nr:serine/threonine-protein kinase Warts isoform X1 [Daphnia magna]XP_045028680.1 serine/threonine-protein kinase Warts isoform X1 [Daphnia magna]XP_045028681.1 serine/threonine-protein kinase Warts isoform X1 [Daphnia magna]